MTEPAAHFDPAPLRGAQLILASVAIALAAFMNVLDMTIANVSLPVIAGDIGASISQVTWIITSFTVATAITVPLTGWLSQRFGTVRLFVVSILLFTLASVGCGMSTNLEMLVLFRTLQGAVSGPMIPLSQTLMLQIFPRDKAGMALAIWAMTALGGPIAGPLLGGWISDNIYWPWIFYINVPTGLLSAVITWKMLNHRESPIVKRPIDTVGIALLVLWVGALQFMLDKGNELDWFGSTEIRVLAVVAAIALPFFIIWELTDEHPVVDLSLFARRNFTVGTIIGALNFGMYIGGVVLIPLWLQRFMGYSATWAGVLTAPTGIVALLLTPFVGKFLPKIDPRLAASVSLALFVLVAVMRTRYSLDVPAGLIVLTQLILGVAIGLNFVPITALFMAGLPPSRMAAAAGLSQTLRMLGVAMCVSLTTMTWDDGARQHYAYLAEHVSAYNNSMLEVAQTLSVRGLSLEQSLSLIERQVIAQAYMLSAIDYFWATALLILVLAAAVWLAKPIAKATPQPLDVAH